MSETKITASAVKELTSVYRDETGAQYFKGLTGYGFMMKDKLETMGEITSSCGIIHPSYLYIVGGGVKNSQRLTAESVKKAVEFFEGNPLAAVLRVSTGRGFAMINGMPKLVDSVRAVAQTCFEITHYGGRSIAPMLTQEIGKVLDPAMEWQSGFECEAKSGRNLSLIRHLIKEDWQNEIGFDRVWADLEKEVGRLTLLHCEDRLPRSERESGSGTMFFLQELNRYLKGSGQIQLPRGYESEIRDDGVVIVRKSLSHAPTDEAGFQAAVEEFNKVCFQAYSLYCEPIGDNPKVGQPQSEVFGLAKVAQVEFSRDSRRSTETSESLIGWDDRTPVFPQDGWAPEKGKTFQVLLQRWGRGERAVPAPPKYDDRYAQKDENTGSLQVVRVEFDGREKVAEEQEFVFETRDDFSDGGWYATALVSKDDTEFEINQTKADYTYHMKQCVRDRKLEWTRVSYDIKEYERSIPATEVWLKAPQYHNDNFTKADLTDTYWEVHGKGIDLDGKEAETYMKNSQPLASGQNEFFNWLQIPEVVRHAHEARYPVCACGRSRYDSRSADHCYKCADYCDCARCSTETYFGKIKIAEAAAASSSLHCDECKKWISQIDLVNLLIQPQHRAAIESEAQKLLCGQIFQGEDAYNFFQRVIELPDADPGTINERLQQCITMRGVETGDGYWMSEFSKEQLEQASRLSQLSEEEATLVIALVADGSERDMCSHGGRENKAPRVNEGVYQRLAENIDRGEFVLAERIAIPQDFMKAKEEGLAKVLPGLRAKWDATPGEGNPEGGYSGKDHYLEKYGKEFIRAQYGTEYRNMGNSRTRHAILAEAEKVVTGNWEAMRQVASFSQAAIVYLKDCEHLWGKDEVLKAFRSQPNFTEDLRQYAVSEERLRELVDCEFKAWCERRENDFWTFLAQGKPNPNPNTNVQETMNRTGKWKSEETNVVVREPIIPIVSMSVLKQPVQSDDGIVVFEPVQGRHFRCPSCGYMERLTKKEFSWYEDGDIVELECSGCGVNGEMEKL